MNKREKALVRFIQERQAILERRQAGKPKPWTRDLILQSYRFCNVHREDDSVTKWIRTHWRDPHSSDRHLWFAMVLARVVNWTPTLDKVGYPTQWRPLHFKKVLNEIRSEGSKVFTGAYMLRSDAGGKIEYYADKVLSPMWENRESIMPVSKDTLESFHLRLSQCSGMGSFMAAQVAADVKYAVSSPLYYATDWWTWAASGPGSRRGLNRVLGVDKDAPWREKGWLAAIQELHKNITPSLNCALHMQDLQNCLCEFDKYERVRLGEGRPRSLYPGGA